MKIHYAHLEYLICLQPNLHSIFPLNSDNSPFQFRANISTQHPGAFHSVLQNVVLLLKVLHFSPAYQEERGCVSFHSGKTRCRNCHAPALFQKRGVCCHSSIQNQQGNYVSDELLEFIKIPVLNTTLSRHGNYEKYRE